jgi:hypothetical protein
MDAISKPLISEYLQRKKSTPNLLSYLNLIEIHFLFSRFFRNNIFKINDIWGKNNNTFVDNQTIFNRLDDKRNWAKIKKINTRKFCLEIKIR